jgi:hypothetical protein
MISYHALVFDDFIVLATGTSVNAWTPVALNEVLAQHDQIGIQVVAEQASGGNLTVQVETSMDGTHWIAKNISPEIPAAALLTNAVNVLPYGGDGGGMPNLRLVRLRFTLAAATQVRAHVKAYVILRDQGEGGAVTTGTRIQVKSVPEPYDSKHEDKPSGPKGKIVDPKGTNTGSVHSKRDDGYD